MKKPSSMFIGALLFVGSLAHAEAPASLKVDGDETHSFEVTAVGSTSDSTFTVYNTGERPAKSLHGDGLEAPFSFKDGAYPGTGGTCKGELPASGSCTVVTTFAPVATGTSSGQLTFTYQDENETKTFQRKLRAVSTPSSDKTPASKTESSTVITTDRGLASYALASTEANEKARATAPAALTLSDATTYNFGTVAVGGSVEKTFTLSNTGGRPAKKISAESLAAPYVFKGGTYPGTGGNCGAKLNAGASCTLVVIFAPSATGTSNGTLAVSYNDGGAAQTSTRGLTGTAAAPGSLSVSDVTTSDFGSLANGGSASRTFTLTNVGSMTVTSLGAGKLSAPFSFRGGTFPGGGTCGESLNAAASCTFVLNFSPTRSGAQAASLTINYFDGASSQSTTHSIVGTGTTPAVLAVSDGATYDFGTGATGSSNDKTFTLTNTGGFSATGLSAAALAAPFTFKGGSYPGTGGSCGSAVGSNVSCTIVVNFAPTTTGSQSATVTIQYSDGVAAQSAARPVQGTGAAPAILALSDGPTYSFGSVKIGGSDDHTFTISNAGGVSATSISGAGLQAPFTFKGGSYPGVGGSCTTTLNSSSSCTIVVTYAPTVADPANATLSIAYNDGVTAQSAARALTGTGGAEKKSRPNGPSKRRLTKNEEADAAAIKRISSAQGHACALLESGNLQCWGDNSYGQLGQGSPFVNVGEGRSVLQIATGPRHSCALLDDASVKCWGSNAFGQLGRLNVRASANPEAIEWTSGAKAVDISVGDTSSCATFEDATTECVGTR